MSETKRPRWECVDCGTSNSQWAWKCKKCGLTEMQHHKKTTDVGRSESSDLLAGVEIKPCPFCGHGAKLSVDENSGYESCKIHYFFCENKECCARVYQPSNDFESAVKAWNNRAS